MYSLEIPKSILEQLWIKREQHNAGSIRSQILRAIQAYLLEEPEKESSQVQETAKRDWRTELESQIKDRNRRLTKKLY